MEDQCSPLSLPYFFQEEGIDELKHTLLYTTLELENRILCVHEEIGKKDQEILHLKNLLAITIKERDEALEKCQRLELEQQLNDLHAITSSSGFIQCISESIVVASSLVNPKEQQLNPQFHNKHNNNNNIVINAETPVSSDRETSNDQGQQTISSSISDENNVVIVSLGKDSNTPAPPQLVEDKIVPKMPLPEKGKFLQAVMEAGPLLQTLLLAGPLPEWQHPPPQLNSIDIPPVTISPSSAASGGGYFGKKRENGGCDSSSPSKYQKAVDKISPLTTNSISC